MLILCCAVQNHINHCISISIFSLLSIWPPFLLLHKYVYMVIAERQCFFQKHFMHISSHPLSRTFNTLDDKRSIKGVPLRFWVQFMFVAWGYHDSHPPWIPLESKESSLFSKSCLMSSFCQIQIKIICGSDLPWPSGGWRPGPYSLPSCRVAPVLLKVVDSFPSWLKKNLDTVEWGLVKANA